MNGGKSGRNVGGTERNERRPSHLWTEQLYEYTEHYYWNPSALNKKTPEGQGGPAAYGKAMQRIHREEIPLNTLFNIMFRLLPGDLVDSLFSVALISGAPLPRNLELLPGRKEELGIGVNVTYPDAVFGAGSSRMFVELKVGAALSLEQIWKYLLAVTTVQAQGSQSAHLVFLTDSVLGRTLGKEERKLFGQESPQLALAAIRNHLRTSVVPGSLGRQRITEEMANSMRAAAEHLSLGWMSWSMLGEQLLAEKASAEKGGGAVGVMLGRLFGDFLAELEARQLWKGLEAKWSAN